MSDPTSTLMSKQQPASNTTDDKELRLRKAIALKEYALDKGVSISDRLLTTLNEAECAKDKHAYLCKNGIAIDRAISELTSFTYPTTGESLLAFEDPQKRRTIQRFRMILPFLLVLGLAGSIEGYLLLRADPTRYQFWGNTTLALSLGLLGSAVFQVFNVIGIIKEKAFTIDDVYPNSLRILLGPAVGWVFYVAINQNLLKPTTDGGNPPTPGAMLLLPFLAGFSTKLMVGIMEKLVQSVMLAFGIDDKHTEILVRKRRSQETAGAVPQGGSPLPDQPPEEITSPPTSPPSS
jgi:hypothetical protein